MKNILLLITVWGLLLPSCKAQITKADKEWIIKKTLNDLIFVQGGSFSMGDVGYTDSTGVEQRFSTDRSSRPVHKVTLDSYSMGKLEVTYKEFDIFCKATGLELVGARYRDSDIIQPALSAVWLDWFQAKAYCVWLKELTKLPFDLPTDAQWEYSARSRGKAIRYATNNGEIERGKNFKSEEYRFAICPPPGTYPPNQLGMYDMSGSKAEWVLDEWYDYTKEIEINPIHQDGGLMVIRGFSKLGNGPNDYSVYDRGYRKPTNTGAGIGIRVVLNLKEPIDINAILKGLGITSITKEEKEAFMPKNWQWEKVVY